MRFRYKVLMINIILLSIAVGAIGFLMIDKNFSLAFDTQIKNAVLENNLVQSSIEYELLSVINSTPSQIGRTLPDIGTRVHNGMMTSDAAIYIRYNDTLVYNSDNRSVPESIFEDLSVGSKNYIICREDSTYQIYVTSINTINGKNLCVITNSDITEAYDMMQHQIQYFKILLIIILCICSIMMYFVSTLLTRPMEKLNVVTDSFAGGDYTVRADIRQRDEIGQLAEKFNGMAAAVAHHMDELHAMVKQREQFVADFTHEIKTPMTSIIGYADMIRSKELSRQRQIMAANYIFSEGKRLEAMSRKLFDLIYLGQNEIILKHVYAVRLAEEVAGSMSPLMEQKQLTLNLSVEPAVISGDRELLKTALINLLDNARKASPEKAEILLKGVVTPEGGYRISVTDHGIGMSPEDAKRICDEFYMIDKSRSRKEGGAGLGMSLVSIIVTKHHADLNIISELGMGTTIEITFSNYKEEASIDAEE